LPPSHAEYTSSGIAITWSSDTAVVAEVSTESFDGVETLRHHQEAGKRRRRRGGCRRSGRTVVPARPVSRPGTAGAKFSRPVGVREDVETVADRTRMVLDVVLVPLFARLDDRRRRGRFVGVDQPDLRRHLRGRGDHEEATAARATDAHVEAVVVLLEHEPVVVGRGPERVPPDLPRAHGLVGRVRMVTPSFAHAAVVDVGHDVVELRSAGLAVG
jgi:hypothetical protein